MNRMTRRDIGRAAFGACVASLADGAKPAETGHAKSGFDCRHHFPILLRGEESPDIYLDSAATTHRPTAVIQALTNFYAQENANPAGALHRGARRAYGRFEGARNTVARFINARSSDEIVWTRGTTEAVNLVATAWAERELRAGDEIVLTVAEHSSNLLPWRLVAGRAGARLHFADVDGAGRISLKSLESKLSPRTRLIAFSHVSNVAGFVNPAAQICQIARRQGALAFVDAAQSAPHMTLDVQSIDCDFLAFSSHKMLGPMGVGVLWARRELLERMSPYQAGANMAHDVDLEHESFEHAARKFGAGTPNASGAIALAAAIDFLESLGRRQIESHERELVVHGLKRLRNVPGLRLLGPVEPEDRVPVFSFVIDGLDSMDVMRHLDDRRIAVRAGDLAALPLLQAFGSRIAVRASCYVYTQLADIDRLAAALEELVRAKERI
jgi:cysteine desulfurase / selenocysteine lyase